MQVVHRNQIVNRPISDDISVKDVNDWATSSETIDKYKLKDTKKNAEKVI